MKNDQLQELREKSIEDLESEVTTMREQLLKGRMNQAVENQQHGIQKRVLRRSIARHLTIINQKKAEVQA